MPGDLPPTCGIGQLSEAERQQLANSNQPAHVGRYRLHHKLGEGGFGTVYLADDPQLQRRVAIKVPRLDRKWTPLELENYRREAQVLAQFEHENIVRVFDIGQDELFPVYIVSQFIDGIPLNKLVGWFHVEKKYRYIARAIQFLAQALKYAHERGVVHRDLKPANVMLRNGDFQIFLMDFGLALRDEDTSKGHPSGTPGYASPEQVGGEAHRVDGRSDLYSLGVLLYEMLSGRVPFPTKPENAGSGWKAWLDYRDRVQHTDVRPPRQLDSSIPKELERICLKLLERRASDRYSCAADLLEDLIAFVASVPETLAGGNDAESVQSVAAAAGVSVAVSPANALGAGLPPSPSPRPQVFPTAGPSPTPGAVASPGTPPLPATPTPPLSDEPVLKIVPKGLRSFDNGDKEFFLDLLPGARDRNGLPGSIRFWKSRIEATELEKTFAIGVLYGPSGCGKSSLVKAGLLPRLSERVLWVYLEASGLGASPVADTSRIESSANSTDANRARHSTLTEQTLQRAVAKKCDLTPEASLTETLKRVRAGQGVPSRGKVLLVIDQFEQWLHANREHDWTELAYALRQCDGVHLQCLLLVRDDFWLSIERFLKQLEVRLRDGENCEAADLFDLPHAKRVLGAFGVAYGALPPRPQDWSAEQREFLDQSVAGLAQENRIISVRLALFAAMVKSRPWTPATLTAIGGVSGVGVTFLEETFSASTAKAAYRAHERAVRGVLKLLLPDAGTDIKGHSIPRDDLLIASGYARSPDKFQSLLEILDLDLRLITPVAANEEESGSGDEGEGEISNPKSFYQLAHDYLVPSIREWLTKKQRETRRGRAALRLEERSAQWNAKPENRYLPAWWEWLNIRWYVPKVSWTHPQKKLMARGAVSLRHRMTACLVALICLSVGTWYFASQINRTKSRFGPLFAAAPEYVPDEIDALRKFDRAETGASLEGIIRNRWAVNDRVSARASYALARLGTDESHARIRDQLIKNILDFVPTAEALEVQNMVVALRDISKATSSGVSRLTSEVSADDDARPEANALRIASEPTIHHITTQLTERVQALPIKSTFESKGLPVRLRYAALALYLGDPSVLSPLVQLGPDPTERTALTLRLKDWPDSTPELRKWLATTTDEALRSVVCAAVGAFPKPADLQKDELVAVLKERFVNAPDGSTHSAIDWTLRQWGVALPDIKSKTSNLKAEPSNLLTPAATAPRRWYTNSVGMTFVEIPAGKHLLGDERDASKTHSVELTRAVYLSNRELSVDQFLKFVIEDANTLARWESSKWVRHDPSVSPDKNCPVQNINWIDSALYCNWLSRKEGLTPCYTETGKKLKVKERSGGKEVEVAEWLCKFDATGYRLPTEAEWEAACRARTTTPWSCGKDDVELREYAVFSFNSEKKKQTSICGTKLPNGWGLFDSHGNVWEWCNDWSGEVPSGRDPQGPQASSLRVLRVLRGGSWGYPSESAASALRNDYAPVLRSNRTGVRLAQAGQGSGGARGAAQGP